MKPKFSMWIPEHKLLCLVETIDFAMNGDIAYVMPEIPDPKNPAYRAYDPKEVVLLLGTGKIDKNGFEIFEGNIIEHKYNSPLSGEEVVHRFQVVWNETFAMFSAVGIGIRNQTSLNSSARRFEIIGTIYTDPELLGVEK